MFIDFLIKFSENIRVFINSKKSFVNGVFNVTLSFLTFLGFFFSVILFYEYYSVFRDGTAKVKFTVVNNSGEKLSDTNVVYLPDKKTPLFSSVRARETNENGVVEIEIPRTLIKNDEVRFLFSKSGFHPQLISLTTTPEFINNLDKRVVLYNMPSDILEEPSHTPLHESEDI